MKLSCPNCGDNVIYKIGTNTIFCKTCKTSTSISNLKYDIFNNKNSMDSKKYICSSCGNTIISIDDSPIEMCNYCGSVEFSVEAFNYHNKINKIIPFALNKDEFIYAFKNHIKGKEFSGIKEFSENSIKSIKGIYVPVKYSMYDVKVSGKKVKNTSTSNFSYNTYGNKATPERAIQVDYDSFFRVDVPFDLNKEINDKIISSIHPYYFESVVDFSPYYVAGLSIGNTNDTYGKVLKTPELVIKNAIYKRGIEERFRKIFKKSELNWNIKQIDVNSNVFVPVWLCSYSFNGQKYEFAMNGQTGKVVAKLPVDEMAVKRNIEQVEQNYESKVRSSLTFFTIMGSIFFIPIISILIYSFLPLKPIVAIVLAVITWIIMWLHYVKIIDKRSKEEQSDVIENYAKSIDTKINNTNDFEDRIIITEYRS